MRLATAAEDFLESIKLRTASTTQLAYKAELKRFTAWAHAEVGDSVLKFNATLIEKYLLTYSARGLGLATIARTRGTLSEFAKWGAWKRLWSADVIQNLPKVRRPKTVPRSYSPEERAKLLALPLKGREHLLRAVLYYSGLRISEALNLKVVSFSSAAKTLTVIGKGEKPRTVAIPDELIEILREWIRVYTDGHHASYIFSIGHQRMTPYVANKIAQRWGRQAGVPLVQPHRFRHTYATMMLERGVSLRLIQHQLGHESIATTAMYLRVVDKQVHEAVSLVFEEQAEDDSVRGIDDDRVR